MSLECGHERMHTLAERAQAFRLVEHMYTVCGEVDMCIMRSIVALASQQVHPHTSAHADDGHEHLRVQSIELLRRIFTEHPLRIHMCDATKLVISSAINPINLTHTNTHTHPNAREGDKDARYIQRVSDVHQSILSGYTGALASSLIVVLEDEENRSALNLEQDIQVKCAWYGIRVCVWVCV